MPLSRTTFTSLSALVDRERQRLLAVDPDRRVGSLRPPASRPERSSGGGFETHFTFAQALTESAKLAKNCLLVISLPASDTPARRTLRR